MGHFDKQIQDTGSVTNCLNFCTKTEPRSNWFTLTIRVTLLHLHCSKDSGTCYLKQLTAVVLRNPLPVSLEGDDFTKKFGKGTVDVHVR